MRVTLLIVSTVVTALAAALGGIALAMLWSISDGGYDPVSDDDMPPDAVPQIVARCWTTAKTSGLVLLVSAPIALFALHGISRDQR